MYSQNWRHRSIQSKPSNFTSLLLLNAAKVSLPGNCVSLLFLYIARLSSRLHQPSIPIQPNSPLPGNYIMPQIPCIYLAKFSLPQLQRPNLFSSQDENFKQMVEGLTRPNNTKGLVMKKTTTTKNPHMIFFGKNCSRSTWSPNCPLWATTVFLFTNWTTKALGERLPSSFLASWTTGAKSLLLSWILV